MDAQIVTILVEISITVCLMLLLYGAWVCLDHLASGGKSAKRSAPTPAAGGEAGAEAAADEAEQAARRP